MATKHPKIYYVKWIANQYKKHWKFVLLLVALTVITTVLTVVFPVLLKHIVDSITDNLSLFESGKITVSQAEAERDKLLLILMFMGLGPIFNGIYPWLRHRGNVTFEIFFRDSFFASILKKNSNFFLKFRTGDLSSRLIHDLRVHPNGLPWLCCSGIFRAFNSTSLIVFCLAAMAMLNPKLTLIACIPLPITLGIFMLLDRNISESFKKVHEGVSEGNDFLEAAYSGIKIIKSFNSQSAQSAEYAEILKRRVEYETRADSLFGNFMVMFEFLNYVGEIFILLFGGIMVIRGEMSIGTYYAFFSYLGMIIFPLMDIPSMFVSLNESSISIDRLEAINEDPSHEAKAECAECERIGAIDSIELKDVSFEFLKPAEPAGDSDNKVVKTPFALKNVNLTLKKGEKVAIVGQIGSGKTTLLNLIAQMLLPKSGKIIVNGLPADKIEISSLRDKIGYIQQEPLIFSETVKNNIDFWRNIPDEKIYSCASTAQLDKEVALFEHGFEEEIGQRGVNLSGGQRQRLSIARALAGSPELLLMDDITASLDSENEQKLWDDLNKQYPHLTCLVVTHRISTAAMADKIIVLKDGKVISEGTHNDLKNNCGFYQNLAAPNENYDEIV
ncbi:MAG: ABC transporter ATP-binding protein [Candidatus Riflebacteria bacterium]|nr:ABC transporter ATP-binding protein [Candidatus Riflebacteria bacterium]